jgi:hypothetical protein
MGRFFLRKMLAGGMTALVVALPPLYAEEALVIFDFEGSLQEWAIPEWAKTSADYVGKDLLPSQDFASHGSGSMQLLVDFPGGGKWTGAYTELDMYVTDWTPFSAFAVDLYLPYNAPRGLQGRIILTVGEKWEWTEMNRAYPLEVGKWTTVKVNLKPGSLDWKFFPEEGFRKDVRKIGLRIESNREPTYQGPVFIDHVRLIK